VKEIYTFYKLKNYYLLIHVESTGECREDFVPRSELGKLSNRFISANQLQKMPIFSQTVGNMPGLLVRFTEGFSFFSGAYIFLLASRFRIPVYKRKAYIKIIEFRLRSRKKLLEALADETSSLEDSVSAFKDYCLSDGYSVWLFDRKTKHFTFQFGSCKPSVEYISFKNDSSLNAVLQPGYSTEVRPPDAQNIIDTQEHGFKTLARIKIDIDSNEFVVLTLYSKIKDFTYKDGQLESLKHFIAQKTMHSFRVNESVMENISRKILSLEYGNPQEFADMLTILISEELKYEAVSLFLINDDKKLELVSTVNDKFKGKPREKICEINSESLTSTVFNGSKNYIHIVYNLNDIRHSNVFNEPTKSEPQNWIGIPIIANNNAIGVLRLKNKYRLVNGEHKVYPPRPIDHLNSYTISELTNNRMSAIYKLNELNRHQEIQSNFSKVFRHELRAPVASIGYATQNIENAMSSVGMSEKAERHLQLKLKDIDTLCNRLGFIVDSYTIDELLDKHSEEKQEVSLLEDMIFPFINMFTHYYEIQHHIVFEVDDESMRGIMVLGNIDLFNIVINSVLDNAAKYVEDSSKPIRICASRDNVLGCCNVMIESYSIPIEEDERVNIFEKDGRGISAIKSQLDGSGIGLWLCKEIMRRSGGEITLERLYNPVKFSIKFHMKG